MIVSGANKAGFTAAETIHSAADGVREQQDRLERNVTAVARPEKQDDLAEGSRERALLEQKEIVRAVRANARSLEAAFQTVGTIIDIKV